jgi:hypothetical protein
MIRKLGRLAAFGLGLGAVVGLLSLATIAPALATDNGTITPVNSCLNANEIKKWYGHDDEAALFAKVTSTPEGLKFDGASLAHRDLDPSLKLADAPKHALLTTVGTVTGVPPLVKFRTDAPFSTLNIDADGKWWSSKINPSDPGGISNPVAGPEEFVDLPLTKVAPVEGVQVKYTEGTTIEDIQIGYATDTGNVATVKSLVYATKVYAFACPKLVASPGPVNSGSASPKPKPSVIKTSKSPAPELALTGESGGTNWPAVIGGVGAAIIAAGAALYYVTRPRRFEV